MYITESYINAFKTIITATAIAFFVREIFRKSIGSNGEEIPSPKGKVPLLGHLLQMRGRLGPKLAKWQKDLGPIFRLRVGTVNWVILLPSSINSLSHLLEREAQKAVDIMKISSERNKGVDAPEYSYLATVNVFLSIMFGIPGSTDINDPIFNKISSINAQGVELVNPSNDYVTLFPFLKILDPILQNAKEMVDYTRDILFPFIKELNDIARKSSDDNLLKRIELVKDEYEINDREILSIMTEALFIGLDNLSGATAWSIAILCNYPEAQKKNNSRQPTLSDRNSLPYVNSVIKECLRLRLSLYIGIPRQVTQDFTYKNYIIPKGYLIVENIYDVNKNPSLFPEPDKFDPERFMNDCRTIHSVSHGDLSKKNYFGFGWQAYLSWNLFESYMFCILTKILSDYTINPTVSPEGKEVYPDLDQVDCTGMIVNPASFKVCLVERENQSQLQ
ncbi:cytochrome P450 [Sporodiniella umbellata]|nr:cytochrome P450 [Sporodiniella umbellata]